MIQTRNRCLTWPWPSVHEAQLTAITMNIISADVNIGKLCLNDMHNLLALARLFPDTY